MKKLIHLLLALITAAAGIVGMSGTASAANLESPGYMAPGTMYLNTTQDSTCSFAFLLANTARPEFLTAGHCGNVGDQVGIEINGVIEHVGEFVWSNEYDGFGTHDAAVIRITEGGYRYTGAVAMMDLLPSSVTRHSTLVTGRPTVCAVGFVSGLSCGPYVTESRNSNNIDFKFHSRKGDSGGPVFIVDNDGKVHAAGIISGVPFALGEGYARIQSLDFPMDTGYAIAKS